MAPALEFCKKLRHPADSHKGAKRRLAFWARTLQAHDQVRFVSPLKVARSIIIDAFGTTIGNNLPAGFEIGGSASG